MADKLEPRQKTNSISQNFLLLIAKNLFDLNSSRGQNLDLLPIELRK